MDRMDVLARVRALITPTLESMGFELVRLRFTGADSGQACLQVMAERPDGRMTIEDCTEVSRALSALLDVEDPIAGAYRLEISSPGIDRPLTRLKDYARWAGHEAKIELKSLTEGRRRWRGQLMGLEGEEVLIAVTDKANAPSETVRIAFADIAEGRLVLTDALIRATAAQGNESEA